MEEKKKENFGTECQCKNPTGATPEDLICVFCGLPLVDRKSHFCSESYD